MRHATDDDLDHLEPLLEELRKLPQLRERKRGSFSRGPHAFLHLHEDDGDFFVDARLGTAFSRTRVTTLDEQTHFLSQVQTALRSTT